MNVVFLIFDSVEKVLFAILCAVYFLQVTYMFIGFLPSKKFPEAKKNHKYGVIIAARNEAMVIAQLIDSIRQQDYPQELLDIFVVADNCTDDTAAVARAAGAIVYERFNAEQKGKSYALDYLLNKLFEDYPDDYKGYLFFDADNLLKKNYVKEMNKAVDSGLRIITSYRNSKNFGTNWITHGYGLCFLRECRFVHRSRQKLNSSTFISGTGFYVEAEILRQEKGWKYNLLTEDIEFSVAQILKHDKVGYAENAEFYDEQPETFSQSYKQRLRWIKGSYQTFGSYGRKLAGGALKKKGYSKFDILMFLMPMPFVLFSWSILNQLLHITFGAVIAVKDPSILIAAIENLATMVLNIYAFSFVIGCFVTFAEWKRIKIPAIKKILYLFLFPLYLYTYIPITFTAMFGKVQWHQIKRNCTVNINELEESHKLATEAKPDN